jgi:hypothetical protein
LELEDLGAAAGAVVGGLLELRFRQTEAKRGRSGDGVKMKTWGGRNVTDIFLRARNRVFLKNR